MGDAAPALHLPGPDDPLPLATITMNVQGMTCASCVRRVERAFARTDARRERTHAFRAFRAQRFGIPV